MKRRILLLCMPVLLMAAGPEEGVKAAEKQWAEAVVKKDYAVLNRVLADDLTYTHSDGRLDSKANFIDALKSGKQTYSAAEHESIDVRPLGQDAAIVRGRLRMTAAVVGQTATPATFSILRVYKRNGNQWQLTAHQSARLVAAQ